MPWWGTVLIVAASAGLAYIGSRQGTRVAARSAEQLDHWRRREETMRMLRWAAELASDVRVEARAAVGVVALQGLTRSELLQPEDRALIEGIYEELVGPALDGYSEGDVVQEEDASRREG